MSDLSSRVFEKWNPVLKKHKRRECRHRHVKFLAHRSREWYCQKDRCQNAWDGIFQIKMKNLCKRAERDEGGLGISTGSLGAAAEMLVCADLIFHGFDVYRAVSPHSPADVTVSKDGKFFKIDVTLGSLSASGKAKHNKIRDIKRFDVIAAVAADDRLCLARKHTITYYPEIRLEERDLDF